MTMLARLPFELAQADNYLIFDDFLRVSPPRQQIQYIAAALAANHNLTATAIWCADRPIRITDVNIFPDGSSSGIDNSDTSAWVLKNGSNTVASTTFNATITFPASHTLTSLGTIANPVVAAGGYLNLTITNGTAAATPATIVQIGYTDLAAVSNWAVYLPNNGNAVVNDGLAGILTLTPSGSSPAQSDEAYVYSPQQVFQPSSGYPLYMEALIQYTEANVNQAGIFFGLASGVSAGGLIAAAAAGIRASGTVVGIYKTAGSTVWSVISQNGANVTVNTSTCPAGGSAYQRLNIEVLDVIAGTATVVFRVDGQLLRDTNNPTLPIKQTLVLTGDSVCSLAAGVKNGSGSMETLNIDYLAAVQSRVVGADG
jgi:hypothetical protein